MIEVVVESEDGPVAARGSGADEVIDAASGDALGATEIAHPRGFFKIFSGEGNVVEGAESLAHALKLRRLPDSAEKLLSYRSQQFCLPVHD